MNNTEFTAPWLIFQVCGGHYAINSGNVTSIIKTPEKISPVPGAPEVFRGIFELRGSVYPVLDMRILFHFKALEKEHSEFMQRADSRKAQLQEWAEKLRGCIEEKNIPYETQVSFGNCLSLLGYPIFFDFYLEQYDLFIQIIYDKCHQKMTREYFNINSKRKFCKDLGCPLLEIESSDLKYIDSNWLQYEIELCAGLREEF